MSFLDFLIIILFSANIVMGFIFKPNKIGYCLGWILALIWFLMANNYIK